MNSCKFTPFGLCVKTELLREGLTQEWLIEEIRSRTGITGQRSSPKIVRAIQDILGLTGETNGKEEA